MEETGLPLLTGRRSWVTELSKDRSLGDRQATGPAPWCGAQGLGQSLQLESLIFSHFPNGGNGGPEKLK